MQSIGQALQLQSLNNTIDDLPDEVLEFILGFLLPYKDLQDCMLVCKRWYLCTKSVIWKTSNSLVRAIGEFNIQWTNITPAEMAPTITKRFSHAACVHENSMYIFGGCTTNSTSFNDLWRFDLSKRLWIRPLATGTYPAPKAYASMICYKDSLILFGGWTYPCPSQLYHDWTMFHDIHFYNVRSNRWILMNTLNNPPAMAGHSAVIHKDSMVVFGGLYKPQTDPSSVNCQVSCSNEVWVLDLVTLTWRQQVTSQPRPTARYAQSIIDLDNNNVMILGGVQAPHNRFVYNDCWILNMDGIVWTWTEITVKNKEYAASNIWCNPACKVGDKVVSLSRTQNGLKLVTSAVKLTANSQPVPVMHRVEQGARRPIDRDLNINGRRGDFLQRRTNSHDLVNPSPPTAGLQADSLKENGRNTLNDISQAGPSNVRRVCVENYVLSNKDSPLRRKHSPTINGYKIVRELHEADKFRMAAFACDTPREPEASAIMQRQVIALQRQLEPSPPAPQPAPKKLKKNTLGLHVMDISTLLNGSPLKFVTWLQPRNTSQVSGAPEELIMYSLVQGKGELIMFGGIHNDMNLIHNYSTTQQCQYSNSLHFIAPPKNVI